MCYKAEVSLASRMDDNSRRTVYFAISLLAGACLYWKPLADLFTLSLRSELYSFIPLMFLVSSYLIFADRKNIFEQTRFNIGYGILVVALSLILGLAAINSKGLFGSDYYLLCGILIIYHFHRRDFPVLLWCRRLKKGGFPPGISAARCSNA